MKNSTKNYVFCCFYIKKCFFFEKTLDLLKMLVYTNIVWMINPGDILSGLERRVWNLSGFRRSASVYALAYMRGMPAELTHITR